MANNYRLTCVCTIYDKIVYARIYIHFNNQITRAARLDSCVRAYIGEISVYTLHTTQSSLGLLRAHM